MSRILQSGVYLDNRPQPVPLVARALSAAGCPDWAINLYMATATFAKTLDPKEWSVSTYKSGPRKGQPCLRHNVHKGRTTDIPESWGQARQENAPDETSRFHDYWEHWRDRPLPEQMAEQARVNREIEKIGFMPHSNADARRRQRLESCREAVKGLINKSLQDDYRSHWQERDDPDILGEIDRLHAARDRHRGVEDPVHVERRDMLRSILADRAFLRTPSTSLEGLTQRALEPGPDGSRLIDDPTHRLMLADVYEEAGRTDEASDLRLGPVIVRPSGKVLAEPVFRPEGNGSIAAYELHGSVKQAVLRYARETKMAPSPPIYGYVGGDVAWVGASGLDEPTQVGGYVVDSQEIIDRIAEGATHHARRAADAVIDWNDLSHEHKVRAAHDLCLSLDAPQQAEHCLQDMARIEAKKAALALRAKEQEARQASHVQAVLDRFKDEAWTLERAKASKGYDARTAERILVADPKLKVVVITSSAITGSGLRKAPKGDTKSPVLHYRKSSGGRYARSVKQTRVVLEGH